MTAHNVRDVHGLVVMAVQIRSRLVSRGEDRPAAAAARQRTRQRQSANGDGEKEEVRCDAARAGHEQVGVRRRGGHEQGQRQW